MSMRRLAYPYGRYLLKGNNITDMGPKLRDFTSGLGFSIVKYEDKNEKVGTLIIGVNKKTDELAKQKKPPGHLRELLSGFKVPSFRDMDPKSQRVGIELYLWPADDGVLLEMFVLPYMEHLNKREIYLLTETKEEEITDWYLCEQIWEHIEPKIVEEFDAEPVHRRA